MRSIPKGIDLILRSNDSQTHHSVKKEAHFCTKDIGSSYIKAQNFSKMK